MDLPKLVVESYIEILTIIVSFRISHVMRTRGIVRPRTPGALNESEDPRRIRS